MTAFRMKKASSAPKHLRPETRVWWRWVASEFELEQHHYKLLRLCCEAYDSAQNARETLQREGTIYRARIKRMFAKRRIRKPQRDERVQQFLDGDDTPLKNNEVRQELVAALYFEWVNGPFTEQEKERLKLLGCRYAWEED